MRKRLTVSALVALAALATAAIGQPPPATTTGPAKAPETKADKKPADPTDAAIAAALAHDPDVRMARAKIQMAEAELAKARQVVTLKVVTLKGKIDQFKAELALAQAQYDQTVQLIQNKVVSQAELFAPRAKVEAAKAALALAEAEWKLLTGAADGTGGASGATHADRAATLMYMQVLQGTAHDDMAIALQYLTAMETGRGRNAIKGAIPERIREALDKPVKLGAKGEKVTFAQALEVFKKETGLDVPIRPMPSPDPVIVSEGEALPVGAWFQLYQDTAGQRNSGFAFYVREYGLLVANKQSAPPDAPTLTEFWKQKPPALPAQTEPTAPKK